MVWSGPPPSMPRAKRDWDLSKRSKVLPKFFSFFFIQKYPKWHFWIDFEGVFPPRLGASRWNKNQFILAAPVFRWGRTMAGEGVDQDPPTLCQTLRGSAQSFGCRCRPRTHAHTHWLVEVHIVRMERGREWVKNAMDGNARCFHATLTTVGQQTTTILATITAFVMLLGMLATEEGGNVNRV